MNAEILARLRENRGQFVLLQELGSDARQVAKDLNEIAEFGHVLEQHPFRGVCYRTPAPRLCPDQIEWQLGTKLIGGRIAVWDRVASTNDLAAAAARSRSNEGLAVFAESQTAGRGRRGRTWVAPSGSSLLVSILLFPQGDLADTSRLMAIGAVAVAELVHEVTGHAAQIKWPNDVRVQGRKIAGVLVERRAGAVIGIGLNVNQTEADFETAMAPTATSLRLLGVETPDRSELAQMLLRRLDTLYVSAMELGPGPLDSAWSRLLEPLGREVALSTSRGLVRGRLIHADLPLGLSVQDADGRIQRVGPHEILEIDGEDSP